MTQKEIDLVFEITAVIFSNPYFEKEITLEQSQAWVAKQLAVNGIQTEPMGASWGVLIGNTKEDDR
jgi:hypothetical protein